MPILKTVLSGYLAFEEAPRFMMLLAFERIGKRIGRVEEFHPPRRFSGVVEAEHDESLIIEIGSVVEHIAVGREAMNVESVVATAMRQKMIDRGIHQMQAQPPRTASALPLPESEDRIRGPPPSNSSEKSST